ncbi:MAG: hypothetical protein ABR524_05050 [Thermoanaerobaculia bacterium]
MALAIVVAAGVFLVTLGAAFLLTPSKASGFLLGFAGSPSKHYAELAVRFLVGGAFLLHAPHMLFPHVFSVAGWILLATTAGLLLVPWRWHRRFAQRAVPEALRFLPLLGISSAALGGLVLVAAFRLGSL